MNKINRMNGSWDGHGLITQSLLCFLGLREALIRSQPSSGVHEAVWGFQGRHLKDIYDANSDMTLLNSA